MKRPVLPKKALCASLALALGLSLASAFADEPAGKKENDPQAASTEEASPSLTVKGRVIDSLTGKGVAGAKVSSLEKTVVTNEGGHFSIGGLNQRREAFVNFRVMNELGRIIGCASVPVEVSLEPLAANFENSFGATVVDFVKGGEAVITISPSTDLNEACAACHKANPCLAEAREGESWSDVTHLGGAAITQAELESIKLKLARDGVSPEMYPNLRYQDAHPQNFNIAQRAADSQSGADTSLGRFRMPDRLPLTDTGVATCDTCHTRHTPTEYQLFLRLDIVGDTLLCKQCHL